ncbi:MAG: hypothetical protein DDT19_00864 [Syntrophomonadaceae bacterium]|nr:hypothetical protein [Bacillota bacterium]
MANINAPIGLWPVRHLTGGEIRTRRYKVRSGMTIFRGDPVVADPAGVVSVAPAAPGPALVGIAAEHVVGVVSTTWVGLSDILVYDDPFIVFGCQSDSSGSIAEADIFMNAQFRVGAGSATTRLSGYELDRASLSTLATHPLRVIGLCDTRDPRNAWGLHTDLEVLLNVHLYKSGGTIGI